MLRATIQSSFLRKWEPMDIKAFWMPAGAGMAVVQSVPGFQKFTIRQKTL